MTEFLRIREWSKYQHYKDRNPPWIKLHRELLSSRTWVELDDASRVLAIACMLLAAATDNKIPMSTAYVRRVAYLNQDPDFSQLIKTQFVEIIDDSGSVLADASKMYQMPTNVRPETETETEKKNTSSPKPRRTDIFSRAYECYPRMVGRRAAEKSWNSAIGRRKNGKTIEETEDFLFQRVMTYAAACRTACKDPQFIPHMATWLNQDRFMDEPSEWLATGKNGHKVKVSQYVDAEVLRKQREERRAANAEAELQHN